MLISKTIIAKWSPSNKKWYENKGYIFTKYKDKLEVKIEDLSNSSHALIDVECDGCNKILEGMIWNSYLKYVQKDGKYYCNKCAIAGHKKWISFYEWCYNNLSKEEADIIMSRWDYDKNIDKNGNKISPKDISYGSPGLNNKGYWFKCLDYSEHESEQKSIVHFTRYEIKNINCNQCNSISITHPHLVEFLVNKEDAYKYSAGSGKKIPMKCLDCGYEKEIAIYTLINSGFGCNKCSDGISYPQKFMFNLLVQLNIIFIPELARILFDWCNKYKYDFYIDKINGIIEVHGIQHYKESMGNWKTSLKEIEENDNQKENLAKENGIKNYIVIDCRFSTIEWIKNSIMQSDLPDLLNFKEEDINWLKCHEYGCNSLVKKTCDIWNKNKTIIQIASILKLNRNTITRYLKQGVELGWCDYKPVKINLSPRKIKLYDKNMILINIFKTINSTAYWLIENGTCKTFNGARCTINKFSKSGKAYKDYYFVKVDR